VMRALTWQGAEEWLAEHAQSRPGRGRRHGHRGAARRRTRPLSCSSTTSTCRAGGSRAGSRSRPRERAGGAR
jgi:hypothetical protein